MPVTNDEQTCSLFALAVYTYLDPVILQGYRVPHLPFDQLPPLSDTDYAKNLTGSAFPVCYQTVPRSNLMRFMYVSGVIAFGSI